jgi:hypothetical protein
VPSRLLIVKVTGKGQTAIDKIVGDSMNDSIEEAKLLLSRTPHVDEIQLLLRLQGQLMSVTAEHKVGEVLLVADGAVLVDCAGCPFMSQMAAPCLCYRGARGFTTPTRSGGSGELPNELPSSLSTIAKHAPARASLNFPVLYSSIYHRATA